MALVDYLPSAWSAREAGSSLGQLEILKKEARPIEETPNEKKVVDDHPMRGEMT
jgi:hypothetical protein